MDGMSAHLVKLMYKVRRAAPEDFPKLLPMAESFYKSTSFAKTMEFHLESVLEHYILLLTHGAVFVGEYQGKPVGMLGVIVSPFELNTNYLLCSERMWWVDPEHRRSRLAQQMLGAMHEFAEASGCHREVMAMLDTSPPELESYYLSQGYRKTETAFVKEI